LDPDELSDGELDR
jgi:hypothetical protein